MICYIFKEGWSNVSFIALTVSNIAIYSSVKRLLCSVQEKRCGSEYVKRSMVLHRTSLKSFTIQWPGELQILLKQRGCNEILTL